MAVPHNGIGNWQKAIRSDLEPWQRYYRKLALTTNLFPVAPQPQSPAADVLLALSKYDSTIEELRQAAARPGSRFPLNYDTEEPFAILLPHLAPTKGCACSFTITCPGRTGSRTERGSYGGHRPGVESY